MWGVDRLEIRDLLVQPSQDRPRPRRTPRFCEPPVHRPLNLVEPSQNLPHRPPQHRSQRLWRRPQVVTTAHPLDPRDDQRVVIENGVREVCGDHRWNQVGQIRQERPPQILISHQMPLTAELIALRRCHSEHVRTTCAAVDPVCLVVVATGQRFHLRHRLAHQRPRKRHHRNLIHPTDARPHFQACRRGSAPSITRRSPRPTARVRKQSFAFRCNGCRVRLLRPVVRRCKADTATETPRSCSVGQSDHARIALRNGLAPAGAAAGAHSLRSNSASACGSPCSKLRTDLFSSAALVAAMPMTADARHTVGAPIVAASGPAASWPTGIAA